MSSSFITRRGNHYNKINIDIPALKASTPTPLSVARSELAATSIRDYALFGGGTNGSPLNVVDAYSPGLTRTTPTTLSQARRILSATSIGNYALFGG